MGMLVEVVDYSVTNISHDIYDDMCLQLQYEGLSKNSFFHFLGFVCWLTTNQSLMLDSRQSKWI